jgi:hypothetical protein
LPCRNSKPRELVGGVSVRPVLRKMEEAIAGLKQEHAEMIRTLSEMREAGQEGTADCRALAEVEQKTEDALDTHRLELLRIGAAGQPNVRR